MGRRHRRAVTGLIGLCAPPTASASPPMLLTSAAALALVAATLQGYHVFAAEPATHADCASRVPAAEMVRGKGAFLSGCVTLSETTYLGGCWTQPDNTDTVGCQTCNIQEEAFSEAVFPVMFPEELDPCPSALDYTALYKKQYGPLSVVTAASLTSTGCPEGWLYLEATGHCYLKSRNTAKAADQADAVSKCKAEGAWVIAINSEEENEFLLRNLLFTGFFGETYTGMVKDTPTAEWTWPEESSQTAFNCLSDYSDWLEGPEEGCKSTYNGGADGSCMEIFPYEPKGWNPFSCIVGKHFVCEMPAIAGGTVVATPAPEPNVDATAAPTPATAAPTVKATPAPTNAPSPAPTVEVEISTTPEPLIVTTPVPAGERELSPTAPPTSSSAPTVKVSSTSETMSTMSSSSSSLWAGGNLFSITKRLIWVDATYSLYLREGDVETAVVTDKTKDGLGTATDSYELKDGCYRLAVTSTGDPTALTWSVTGGDPYGSTAPSGEGLDGGLYTVGGGVCGIGECQSSCLSDLFRGDDAEILASGTCDGHSALIAGACSDLCPEDDEGGLKQKCVQAGCTPDVACGVNIGGGDDLRTEYRVEVSALVEVPVTTSSGGGGGDGAGDAGEEFEMAVGSWLGVDPGDLSVTAVDGVDVQAEEYAPARRGLWGIVLRGEGKSSARADNTRGLQTDSFSEATFTRYKASVKPANLTMAEATSLQEATAAEGSAEGLQGWLRESGSSWREASVASVEGGVVEFFVVSSTSGADGDKVAGDMDGDNGGAFDNPLLIGGIAAAAVVVAALLVMMCRSRSKKKQRKPARRGSQGPLTQDFEGGGGGAGFELSDSRQPKRGRVGGEEIMPLYKDDQNHRFNGSRSNGSSRHTSLTGKAATVVDAASVVMEDPSSPEGGTVFIPVDLGDAEAVGGSGSGAAKAMSAATIAHQHRQQQRQRQHQQLQQQAPGGGGGCGGGGGRSWSYGEVSDADGGGSGGIERVHGSGSGGIDRASSPPGSSGSSPEGSRHSRQSSSDAASTASMSLRAQESVTGAGGRGTSAPQHKKAPSSKLGFNGVEVKDASTLDTKRPSVRGPSGALASLGFARGHSLDFEEEGDGGGGKGYRGEGSGSLYDGGSEAGSRYNEGGESGSAGRAEAFVAMTQQQAAEARIRELKDRQGGDADPVVTLKARDMLMKSPAPFSPGTDWDLAAGIAPSPGGDDTFQEDGPSGRRRFFMVNPSSGVVHDRNLSTARRASRRRGEEARGRAAGAEVGDASRLPTAAADRSFRPPVSRSRSIGRQGGEKEQKGRRGGSSSASRRSGTPARTGIRGSREGGSRGVAAGQERGQGLGPAADSDCDSAGAAEQETLMMAASGSGGAGVGAGAGAPRTPRACEDSDGGSRFYGSSGDERHPTPGAGGGPHGMPAPSPLTMVHHRRRREGGPDSAKERAAGRKDLLLKYGAYV
eukprot:g6554.t1